MMNDFKLVSTNSRVRTAAEQESWAPRPTVHDMTDDRRAAEVLAEAQSMLAISNERERIARDLHDTVIQRLFATGLTLQAALGRDDWEDRVDGAIVSIDEAIRELRTSIFTLRRPIQLFGVADSLRTIAEEVRRVLSASLEVKIGKEVDYLVSAKLGAEIAAVIRESLTNVIKHADAQTVVLTVEIDVNWLVARIDDDGIGFSVCLNGGLGLRNLVDRAQHLGGHCEITSSPGNGTSVVFAIPL